ncbi:hypothetical protein LIP_2557 [Limnochorda pilosa]|uniref:Uncharacterized protein n=1 Tax=Limnochorda pilosa TaxID=1555112 RepID=A0A0K2SN06_LIMPI|nr:hypothetical protein LIP_2557 [Limnochorda pilosa]
MRLVETVVRAVYGRGSERFELPCDVRLNESSRYPEKVLGTHATNGRLLDSTIVTDAAGQKRVRVSGNVDLHAWCKGREGTFVVSRQVPFVREIAIPGAGEADFRNEEASARLLEEPSCGPGSLVKLDGDLCVRAPLRLHLGAEIVGDRRVFAYIRAASKPSKPVAPGLPEPAEWVKADEIDYD